MPDCTPIDDIKNLDPEGVENACAAFLQNLAKAAAEREPRDEDSIYDANYEVLAELAEIVQTAREFADVISETKVTPVSEAVLSIASTEIVEDQVPGGDDEEIEDAKAELDERDFDNYWDKLLEIDAAALAVYPQSTAPAPR